MIEAPQSRYNGIKHSWWIKSGDPRDKLAHAGGEVDNVVQLEVIGVSRDDKVESIVIAILGVDYIKCLVDVIQQKTFLS